MKIGLVTACYKPVINGVTHMVALYQAYLEQAGHEVTIFTLGRPTADVEPDPRVVRSAGWALAHTGYYVAPRYDTAAQARLAQMDILHCHHLVMSLEFAARYGRAPILYTNHTRYDLYANAYTRAVLPFLPEPTVQIAADALMRRAWPRLTNLANVVISPSTSVAHILRQFGVERPIQVIENGIELTPFFHPRDPLSKADFNLPVEAVLWVYVGRLALEKRLTHLLHAFAHAQAELPHLHLLIIGDGPQAAELAKLAAELGVANHIVFTGAIPFDEVPNYLAAADGFITASISEVHPLTVIEAMAAGLPIVACASPGISDSVPTEAGLVVETAAQLPDALVRLSQTAALRTELGRHAQQASHRFDIRRTVRLTLDLYEQLQEAGQLVSGSASQRVS